MMGGHARAGFWRTLRPAAFEVQLVEASLPPWARLGWVALRMVLPPHGYGEVYTAQLERWTGLDAAATGRGLAALEAAGILRRDGQKGPFPGSPGPRARTTAQAPNQRVGTRRPGRFRFSRACANHACAPAWRKPACGEGDEEGEKEKEKPRPPC